MHYLARRPLAALIATAVLRPPPSLAGVIDDTDGVAAMDCAALRPAEGGGRVFDVQGYLGPKQLLRLERILAKLEEDTGYRLRVVSQARASSACLPSLLSRLGVVGAGASGVVGVSGGGGVGVGSVGVEGSVGGVGGGGGGGRIGSGRAGGSALAPDAIVIVADRGIAGSLESGGSLLKFLVGQDVLLVLPPVFWARLRREYGGIGFVAARGEESSIVSACEVVLSCLRNEEYCVDVPPASSSFY